MLARIVLFLLLLPGLCLSYTVVRKDGRPFSGELVKETPEAIVLRDPRGVEVKFRTDQLDLEKTKTANSGESSRRDDSAETRAVAKRVFPEAASPWRGEPISVDFKDIDIRDFFRFIADLSGMNMILDPGVKGTLTLKLTEVPWDQVLDLVCRTHGLAYEVDGNVMLLKN